MQVEAAQYRTYKCFPLRSRNVETIQVHHLVPCRHKVTHKRLLRIAACIDFSERAELGVLTEDKINDGACPLEFARRPRGL